MTETANQAALSNGELSNGKSSGNPAAPEVGMPAVGAEATLSAEASPSAAQVNSADAASGAVMVREAISLIKEHPIGTVATVAAATALVELPFAVGVLAGLGASALLSKQSGAERRKLVLERGRWALERARALKHTALERKRAAAAAQPTPVSPV